MTLRKLDEIKSARTMPVGCVTRHPGELARRWANLLFALCLLAFASGALGYLVGPAPSLEKVAAEADLIFKGEVIGSEEVKDQWFQPVRGYVVRKTRFRVISAIKGEAGKEVRFRHFAEAGKEPFAFAYLPQFYRFELGATYILCAHKAGEAARQMRQDHTSRMDVGVLRCRDVRPVVEKTLPAIFWAELIALRDSPVPEDAVYAIKQWDGMSALPGGEGKGDFSRIEVLSAVQRLIARPEPEIAQAAIRLVGAGSPYLDDTVAPWWLSTVGVPLSELSKLDLGLRNAGGALAWRELAAVANSAASPETRALAIRALGLVRARALNQMMRPWLQAPEVPVRAAAMLLYADFATPDKYTTERFAEYAADPAPEVRKCVAYAMGFTQNASLVPVLTTLISDDDKAVRRAASESLRSFDPRIPVVEAALKADFGNAESQPLGILALAKGNPGAYLEALAQVIEMKTEPTNWTGGEIPAFTAWKLLFKYLRARPADEVRAGRWDRYLNALEKVGQYSSSEPRDLYAFYLQRGLPERAAKYRAAAKKTVSYDLDYYFNQADGNPAAYDGN